jgi:hypothetical protein
MPSSSFPVTAYRFSAGMELLGSGALFNKGLRRDSFLNATGSFKKSMSDFHDDKNEALQTALLFFGKGSSYDNVRRKEEFISSSYIAHLIALFYH